MKAPALDKASFYRIATISVAMSALILTGIVIVVPFIPAMLLALIFTMSTWPAFSRLEARLGHRTTLAAGIMTVLLALGFIVPLFFLAGSLADNFTRFSSVVTQTLQNKHETPPEWVASIPFAKSAINKIWANYIQDTSYLTETMRKYASTIYQGLIVMGTAIAKGVIDLTLGILFSFFLFRHGMTAFDRVRTLIEKFIGGRALHLMTVSKSTMISIVYGILGTALAQGTAAAIGFAIAGVPGPVFLALLTCILSLVPVGPPLIWIPAALWLFTQQKIGMGIFMLVYGFLVISAIDNVMRPYLISLNSRLPLLLVLVGIGGGILAFGFSGLFIGPAVLAVIYTLILEATAPRSASA